MARMRAALCATLSSALARLRADDALRLSLDPLLSPAVRAAAKRGGRAACPMSRSSLPTAVLRRSMLSVMGDGGRRLGRQLETQLVFSERSLHFPLFFERKKLRASFQLSTAPFWVC